MIIKGAKKKPAAPKKVEVPVAAPVKETPKEPRKEKKAKPAKVELDVIETSVVEETPEVENIEE